jgi:glyoxylase-like metal-dependent hydrolase (beta-lactamase superfamily II)
MLVVGFPAGPFGTNCFLAADGAGSECVVIDPGMDALPGIEEAVREHRLRPAAVLLTHGHLDHTWSVYPVCSGYGIPGYIHPQDAGQLSDPLSGVSGQMAMALQHMAGDRMPRIEPDEVRPLADGEVLELVGIELQVRHGPGHTPGSVSFHGRTDRAPLMFSGDLLFEGSIGRTDLPGGDHGAMLRSLADVVLPLADDTLVLPGHGGQTTVGRERASNPFLQDLPPAAPRKGL